MPTAAPATITTAPSAISQRCRRRRRASAALACAIFWRACCCLFRLLLDTAPFPDRATGWRAECRAAASTAVAVCGLLRRQYCLALSAVMVLRAMASGRVTTLAAPLAARARHLG